MLALALLAYPVLKGRFGNSGALAVPSGDATSLINRSLQLCQAGRYQEAIAAGRDALKLNPNSEIAYNNIAVAYAGMGMWDDAIANIQQALRIKPDFQLAQNNLAWYVRSKQGGSGAPVAAPSNQVDDHINRSLAFYEAGRFQDCVDEARQALKLKPDSVEAYNNIAAGYIRLENWDEAIRAAQQALRINPGFERARNNLTYALQRKAGPPAAGK